MPEGFEDIYTPTGIEHPAIPTEAELDSGDHSLTLTWKPSYPEQMRRVDDREAEQ
jgi:hypothetical protein